MILDFVNKRFNREVPLSLPLTTVLIKNVILFTILGVTLSQLARFRKFLINPNVWMVIAILGYVICTSGFVYS